MKLKPFWLAVLVPAALLVGVGCGGGDTTSSGGDAPSKEEYVAQADDICREAEDALTAEIEESFSDQAPGRDEIGEFVKANAAANLEGQLSDLRALTPPEGDEETLASIYDTLEVAVGKIIEDPASISGPISQEIKDASQRALEYGMTKCGN